MTRRKETRKKSEVLIGSTEHSSVTRTAKNGVATTSLPLSQGITEQREHSSSIIQDRPHGMGAILADAGVAFRVWAPHAKHVAVAIYRPDGEQQHQMESEENGNWFVHVADAKVGDEYRFQIHTEQGVLSKIDPYAREVTNSVGNGVVHDPAFDWDGDSFEMPNWNELVVYEMHVGTFNRQDADKPSTFDEITQQFDHLKRLGVNCIQVMPIAEFAGDVSWGYNPAHMFAVEQAYGGPKSFKQFVKQAHQHGFAVVLDVVYNHFGPSDLDLWRFDGWSENDGGGIYFYNDWRRRTPWGDTRPDYGRGEVRQFIRDNAFMWLEEYHVDGLRYDMTLFIRSVDADGSSVLAEGWSLLQWMNGEIHAKYPKKILIAEDLQNNEWLTKEVAHGGAGFSSQWDARFVHPIREAAITPMDEHRSMTTLADAIRHRYNTDAFERVIYSESHDEVANGRARVPHEIDSGDATGWFAKKRSTLAAALVFTAPGIPMIFQGQEFLEGDWFRDNVPIDWDKSESFQGITRLYRDLIRLRRNKLGVTKGLIGQNVNVFHIDDDHNMLAFHRWEFGGKGDDVVVLINFSAEPRENHRIGVPHGGRWQVVLNSDWKGYCADFTNHPTLDVDAVEEAWDGMPFHVNTTIGPYSVVIFAQTPE